MMSSQLFISLCLLDIVIMLRCGILYFQLSYFNSLWSFLSWFFHSSYVFDFVNLFVGNNVEKGEDEATEHRKGWEGGEVVDQRPATAASVAHALELGSSVMPHFTTVPCMHFMSPPDAGCVHLGLPFLAMCMLCLKFTMLKSKFPPWTS